MDYAVLRQRRAAREREVRRRRQAALAALLVVVVVVVAVVLAREGGGHGGRAAGAAANAAHAKSPTARDGAAARAAASRRRATAAAQQRAAAAHTRATAAARTRADAAPPVFTMPGAHRAPHEPVPILMYHVIGVRLPSTPNPTLWVSPAAFTAHVHALKQAGYHAVTLQDVWDAWHHHGKLPSKPVVLSFDDGYLGQVLYALPALKRAGWPGVLNLKLGNMRDMGGTKAIKRMIHAGWEVDSHTITHPDLTTVGAAQLAHEISGSRARLKRYFGVPVNFFCYPSGRYDATVIAAVKRAGYAAATTVQLGWATPAADPFTLPRVRVDGGMTGEAVLQRMRDLRPASTA